VKDLFMVVCVYYPVLIIDPYRSSEWNAVSEARRKELGLVVDKDGEFW